MGRKISKGDIGSGPELQAQKCKIDLDTSVGGNLMSFLTSCPPHSISYNPLLPHLIELEGLSMPDEGEIRYWRGHNIPGGPHATMIDVHL